MVDFTVKRNVLSEQLSRLVSVIDPKSPIPVLAYIQVEATGGVRLRMTATNLDITMTTEFNADAVEQGGTMLLPARRTADLVRMLPEGFVHIQQDDQQFARVQAAGSRSRIPAPPADNFPPRPDDAGLEWLNVPSKMVLSVLKAVEYAAAPEEDVKYLLKGARLEIAGTELHMAATDSHRFAVATAALDVLTVDDIAILVPQRGLQELARLLADLGGDGRIGIARTENRLFFRADERTLCIGLLVGEFPDFRTHLLPKVDVYAPGPVLKADELAGAIRRALLAADSRSYAVRFALNGDGLLHLTAQTAEQGEAHEELALNGWTGAPVTLWCNAKFLLEYLAGIAGGLTRFDFPADDSPMRALHLRGERDGVVARYVVMPLDIPV